MTDQNDADPRQDLVPEWSGDDPITAQVVKAIREQHPEVYRLVLDARQEASDPTFTRPRPTPAPPEPEPKPEPKFNADELRESAFAKGIFEGAVEDFTRRVEDEMGVVESNALPAPRGSPGRAGPEGLPA